jgi:hypothetical protein
VADGGVDVAARPKINFVDGSNVTVTVADNPGSERVDVTIASTAAGTGDVVGPVSAVDGNYALFDTATGKLIKDAGVGPTGGATPSEAYTYDNVTTEADPGVGNFRMDSTTKTLVTELYLDNQSFSGSSVTLIYGAASAGDVIIIHSADATNSYARYVVDSVSLETGYIKILVTLSGSAGPTSFTDGDVHTLRLFRMGSPGIGVTSVEQASSSTGSSSGADSIVPFMQLTPGAGTYTVMFWGDVDILGGSDWVDTKVYSNNTIETASTVRHQIDDVFGGRLAAVNITDGVTVAAGQGIDIRYQTNDTTGVTWRHRRLILIRE